MKTKNKKKPTDCFVSGALATVLHLSRIAAIAPLHFVREGTGWRVSISSKWGIYGYVLVTTLGGLTLVAVIIELCSGYENITRMQTIVRCVVYLTQMLLATIVTVIAISGAPILMRSMISYLNRVQEINSEMNMFHCPKLSEGKKTGLVIIWATIITVSCIVDYIVNISKANTWESGLDVFGLISCCILEVQNLQFSITILHVRDSYMVINENLRNLQLNVMMKSKVSQDQVARKLARSYVSLCQVVREVDQCYGLILTMMLCYLLLLLIGSPYFLIKTIVDFIAQPTPVYVFDILMQILWSIINVLNLILIAEPCHLTYREMETTRELVSQLLYCPKSINDPLAVELTDFYKHIILNNVCYNAMKTAVISRALVGKILGSIITNLVIILQLEKP